MDSAQRSPLFPDIPIMSELGCRSDFARAYFGLYSPAGTPKPIVQKIRDEVARILSGPGSCDKHLVQRGLEPVLSTPEDSRAFSSRTARLPAGWCGNRVSRRNSDTKDGSGLEHVPLRSVANFFAVIPGRANRREPGIHSPGSGYGFQPPRSGPGMTQRQRNTL